MQNRKVVLITGASSGIGLETAKMFIEKNWIVYGLSRNNFEFSGMNHMVCDVSNFNQCENCVNTIISEVGKIDVLISNAGMGIGGAVEDTPVELAEKIMNVNFMGGFNIAKAVLPHMRNAHSGRIVLTSSVASFVALPYQGFYSASKAALDSLFSAMRAEVKPFGIKIVSVQPGDAKTGFTSSREKFGENSAYGKSSGKSISKMEKSEQNGISAKSVAKVIYKCSTKKHPPQTKIVGFSYKLVGILCKILPKRIKEWIVFKIYA